MPALSLSVGLTRNPMSEPIRTGRVLPEGTELNVSTVHPSELYWRQLKFREFDISELSLASLSIAASQGMRDWVAIPVFTTRKFFHTNIVIREGAGIDDPKDLVGKRIGVPEYQQTSAVWSRGALQHEFGVLPQQMAWFMERSPEKSHGGATQFTPPPGIDLSYIPPSTNVGEMLAKAELDAAVTYIADVNLVDRSRAQAGHIRNIRKLFQNPVAEGVRYFSKTGILPVNHVLVVRAELLQKHPWLALNLYGAFLEAKRLAMAPLAGQLEPWRLLGLIPADVPSVVLTNDPLPYGMQAQLPALTTLAQFLFEQGLLAEPIDITSLFATSTLDV